MTPGHSLIVDSHAFIWYVQASRRLSDKARQAMDDTTAAKLPLLISAVTLVELVYLMEEGRFREANIDSLFEILYGAESGFEVAFAGGPVGPAVGRIPGAAVTDPFDRMIAATALVTGAPLVTYDHQLRELATRRRPARSPPEPWTRTCFPRTSGIPIRSAGGHAMTDSTTPRPKQIIPAMQDGADVCPGQRRDRSGGRSRL